MIGVRRKLFGFTRLGWALVVLMPVLLVVAIITSWLPAYIAFVADMCGVALALQRTDPMVRMAGGDDPGRDVEEQWKID